MPHILPDTLTKYSDRLNYFENLAESSVVIQHRPKDPQQKRFFSDPEAIAGGRLAGMIMLVVFHPFGFQDADSDNQHMVPKIEVSLMKAVGNNGEAAIQQALDETEAEMKFLLRRMLKDSEPGAQPRLFTYFKLTEVTVEFIDIPKFSDGWCGTSAIVPMGSPENFVYDQEDEDHWN